MDGEKWRNQFHFIPFVSLIGQKNVELFLCRKVFDFYQCSIDANHIIGEFCTMTDFFFGIITFHKPQKFTTTKN